MFAEALIVTEEIYNVGESHNFPRTFAPYFTFKLIPRLILYIKKGELMYLQNQGVLKFYELVDSSKICYVSVAKF